MDNDAVKRFEAEVDRFVGSALPKLESIERIRDSKAIHDAVWGTHVFNAFEMAIIDTPLFQRLRGIHQTGFAYLTYPAAHHTRFEHSLGVVIIADRLLEALRKKGENISPAEVASVRLAALLHDCGHGLLSHISERQIENHHWIKEYRKQDPAFYKPKPHELLSFIVISSKPFRDFFNKLKSLYREQCADSSNVELENAAGLIIGKSWHHDKKYLADIINGPFDADKLDYFTRDAYFTGLRTSLDIDRLLYSMYIEVVDEIWLREKCRDPDAVKEDDRRKTSSETSPRRLAVKSSGASALEQILFSKMQLYSTVYHHHKVRSAESMLSCCVDYVKSMGGRIQEKHRLESPVDFIKHTDWEWLYSTISDDDFLATLIKRLTTREIFKRALVISRRTVNEGLENFLRLSGHENCNAILDKLRDDILSRVTSSLPRHTLTKYDIIIDFPTTQPSLREAEQTPIIFQDESLGVLNHIFPDDDWLHAYYTHKWQAYVFCLDIFPQNRLHVAKAAKTVLENNLGLKFNDNAFKFAHLKAADVYAIR